MTYSERQRAREEWQERTSEVIAEAFRQIERHKAHLRLLTQETAT